MKEIKKSKNIQNRIIRLPIVLGLEDHTGRSDFFRQKDKHKPKIVYVTNPEIEICFCWKTEVVEFIIDQVFKKSLPKSLILYPKSFYKIKLSKLIKRGWKNVIKKPSLLFNHREITIKTQFDLHHGYGVLEKAISVMDEKDKIEFKEFVNKNTKYNPHIMFISKKKIINKWFKSLFSWLFSCEKEFGLKNLKGYDQQRLYAYLAERYLSFWFKKNTKYLEWYWTFFENKSNS